MTGMAIMHFDAESSLWADVTPVSQDDGPSPLCPINYSPSYSKAMDLVRALLPADELSPRALLLTEHLSQLCPSSYTIWHYRARILIHGPETGPNGLGKLQDRLQNELKYLDELATKNMKNYQVWQHRKLIVSTLGDASQELRFIDQVLQVDSKNYHTWVYRQWVLSYFGGLPSSSNVRPSSTETGAGQFAYLWKGELDFVDKLLSIDGRNNSAWNHRYFCIFASNWAKESEQCEEWWKIGKTFDQVVRAEIAFAKSHIATIPNNASAWNYLRGVTRLDSNSKGNCFACASSFAKTLVPSAEEVKTDPALDAGGKTPSLALEWLLDDAQANIYQAESDEQRQTMIKQAELYVNRLCIADPIRSRYWRYRLMALQKNTKSRSM